MMPLAPTTVMAMPTSKPKIGFSIDSIVGNRFNKKHTTEKEHIDPPSSPLSDCSQSNDHNSNTSFSSDLQKVLRIPNCSPEELYNHLSSIQCASPPSNYQANTDASDSGHTKTDTQTRTDIVNKTPSPSHQIEFKESTNFLKSKSSSPILSKTPIIVPGIPAGLIRPFPQNVPSVNDFKPISPYLNSSDIVSTPSSHFIAAQFTAAALASQGFPPTLPQHNSHLHNANLVRDSYPLYPWLLNRHGRIFPHRFPGSK